MKKIMTIILGNILLASLTASTQAISRWEYWPDENYSARVTQDITAVPLFHLSDSLNFSSLLPGLHTLNMRFMDTAWIWSSVKSSYFLVLSPAEVALSANLKYGEYWFDNLYPGITIRSFTPSATIRLLEEAEVSALSDGLHTINIRFGDESGLWSIVSTQFFLKVSPATPVTTNKLTKYRIWFDNDLNTMEVFDIQPKATTFLWLENFETPFLTIGDHIVNYQFRDSVGLWSAAMAGTFYNSSCLPHTGRSIVGPAHVCKNLNGVQYYIRKIKNASGYTWTVPEGATILAGQNTEMINVHFSDTAQSGLITVMADNSCGNGELITMQVTVHPLPVPEITGDTVSCSGVPVHLATEGSVYMFDWTFSPGAQVVSGGGVNDSSAMVQWSTPGSHWAEVHSTIIPGCSSLTPGRIEVNSYPLPVPVITGEVWSNVNDTSVFISESGKSDYIWSLPSGNSVVSGGTLADDSVVVMWKSEGEKIVSIAYTDEHGCTAATPASLTTWVNPCDTCYCSSGALLTWGEDITRVAIGTTLDNSTPCASLTGSQGTASGTADLYSDFTNLTPTMVRRNLNNPFQVEITQCDGFGYSHDVRIYFDFNRNYSFFDPGEEFIIWPYYFSNTHTIAGEIFIPADVPLGITRMRVVCTESPENGPCHIHARGETEDYLVEIWPNCIPPDTIDLWVSGTLFPNHSQSYKSTQTITVSNFIVVAPGGSAEFIAGQKITFLPGTTVQQNAHMLARIALNNDYCQPGNKLVAASFDNSDAEEPFSADHPFRIFPNPASGKFTLRTYKVPDARLVTVQLYNIKGELLLSTSFIFEGDHEFNLNGIPDGLYFARVICGSASKVIKLIIQH